MGDLRDKFCEKFGVNPDDFEPTEMPERDRVDLLEECILEIAEIIGGGEE